MYDKQAQTNKSKDEHTQGRIDLGMNRVDDKGYVYHCANRMLWQI